MSRQSRRSSLTVNEGSVTRAPAPGPVATGGGVADAPVGGSAVPVAAAPRGKVPDGRPPARPEEHAQGPDAAVAGEAPGEAPVASPLGPSPAAAGGPPPDTPGAGTPRPDPASQDKPPKAAVSGPGEGAEGPDQNAEGPDQNALGPDQNAEGPDQNAEGPSQGAGSPDETGPAAITAVAGAAPVAPGRASHCGGSCGRGGCRHRLALPPCQSRAQAHPLIGQCSQFQFRRSRPRRHRQAQGGCLGLAPGQHRRHRFV